MNWQNQKKNYSFLTEEIGKIINNDKDKRWIIDPIDGTTNFLHGIPHFAISIELPNQVNCKVSSTDVALKGQTVSSSYKPAILYNGIKIQVPPFIESEDEIIVDTRTIEYVKKV